MRFKQLFQRKTRLFGKGKEGRNGHTAKGILYELWSRDTFEGRTFLCDVYDNYEEAVIALRQCRKSSLTQDEVLRDTYWLVGTDAARVAERERMESERIDACRRERQYNPEHLRSVCERALDKFADFLEENRSNPVLDRSVDTEWYHRDDCFDRVGLKLGRSGQHGVFYVTLWIWIRASGHYDGGGNGTFVLSGENIKGLCVSLRNAAVRDRLVEAAESLIRGHFEGRCP